MTPCNDTSAASFSLPQIIPFAILALMPQMLLFPDPRPLVDRLGAEFFRRAPQSPGVYLMRDSADSVLYVGKARNLRKRLASYRVANPDRLRRRHLRLLRTVTHIEIQECPDETSALATESKLLRELKPRFNRAGTWPASPRFLTWRITPVGIELSVTTVAPETQPVRNQDFSEWHYSAPLGGLAVGLCLSLLRLLWCAIHPAQGLANLPQGWFNGRCQWPTIIPRCGCVPADLDEAEEGLRTLFAGDAAPFMEWIRSKTLTQTHPFVASVREADSEKLLEYFGSSRALC